ncbi:prepilin peptidase CpaA [Bacillus oleivorans]|uniref:Prepilin peptidase CpaA n=1 Tax=Bacillus oleivorans TaxID=1448271 RepID=A0A285CH76_9BACI|nr:prepilin peptidase [Bacillus oleivorans]SNX66860.1 prepilin peptidase CpaA [Bacillus oleivorans]
MIDLLLWIVLIVCVITDLRERRIYNKVIYPALVLTIIFHLADSGLSGMLFSLQGFVIGMALLLIPYLLGGIGAGDVKLLALVGAMKGTMFVLIAAVYMALIGGVLALGVLLFRRGVISRLKMMFYSLGGLRTGIKIPLTIAKDDYKATYPYGLAIAGGAALSFMLSGVSLL